MLVRAAGRRTRRNTSLQLTQLADSLYLPFLCPAQLRWNSTHSQQAPQPRPSTRLQSSQPDKTQTRRLATVTDQHSTTSDSSRWTFGGVEYSLNPKDTLMLQHSVNDASESQRRYKNGLAGNVPDLMQNLHTCLRVERFERAVLVIERLRLQCHRDSFELQHAHNAYLTACLENIQASQQDDRLAPYDAMRDWFEIELVQKEFNVEAQILVTMMRAAMAALQGVKQERAMRRYAELAEASGILDDVCDAEDFSDDEFLRLGAVLPTLKSRSVHEAEEPIETAKEVPSDPSVQAMPQLTDMPAILEVAQKGMGLASLKQTLSHASPALQSANTPEAMEKANLTPEERQRLLEESASIAAIARWKFEEEHLQKLGIHTTLEARPLGALMWQWYSDLLPVLREEIEACRALLDGPQQPGATDDRLIYGPFVEAVPVEQLAATTILSVMGSLASGKERSSGTYNSNQRLGRLTASLGRTMQDEANAEAAKQRAIAERRAKLGRAPKRTKPKQIHPGYDTEMHVWPSDVRVKLGAMLISKLIETAKIPVTRQHPRTKEMVTQLQAAFLHKTLYESGRKQGWLCPSPDLLHKLHREPVGGLIAKRLPMVIEPRPWTNFSKGGYLNYPTPVIRFSGADAVPRDYAYAAIQRGDLEKVFEALNVLGKVPWKINENVLRVQIEAWNTGEPIANFAPLDPNIDMPPEPNKSDSKARRSWIQLVKDLENVKGGYHSQRCFQNFQLEIAKAFSKEKIYFPHNIDFRGRAYPVPPYLNHMGADNARALMTFANGKELGEVGLRWLKIHLANVYGFDKASLTEREQFAMDHLEDIRDSVANPLGGKKWWLESEDAWQTLAACYELKAAMDLPDPTKYVSYLPVHQDGTCNGLQHYAALGGDAAGARQVNLEPGDRPSDVYTAVAEGVKAEVEKDKAAGHPVAQFLHGKITRKVVKQPVMTNVYGVTYYGAREQVKKQLEEIFPEIHRHDALDHLTLASYVAKKIFKSLGEMFKGAQAIQTWLGDCADRISTCVTPEQIASIQKDDAEGKSILPAKNATPKNAGKTKATGSSLRAEASKQLFRSSVIWTTPLRLPVVQPYRSSKRRQVKTNLQNIALQEPTSIDPVSKRKQLQGFPPNFIHSLDATHMMLSAIKCNENNIAFASIHDSFWTHACDVPDLSKVLRDAFVAMHTEDVVGRLRQEFIARYKDCMYLAAVDIRTPVGKKILAAQKARPTNRGKVKQLQPALIVQLLEEVERLRLINSENPEEVAQGEELITSGSIFAEEADAEDALTVPIEIVNSRLGEIPENSDIFAASELETNDLTEPVLSDNDDVDITSDDKVAKAAEDAEAEDDAVPTLESLKAKRVKGAKKEQVRKVFVWLPLKFPEVPEKGDFDVTRLKESQYFFH